MYTRTKEMIERERLIVIVRRVYDDNLISVAKALYEGGVRLMEITFDQEDPDCITRTPDSVAILNEVMKGEMLVGTGTVMNTKQAEAAAAAGARYIISPHVDEAVVKKTKELGLVSIPGAMTPTEIAQAHNYGADYVKVFPVDFLGISYFKSILGPLSHVKFLATGSVNEQNISTYLNAGFAGAGIGGRLADKELIKDENFAEITRRARIFIDACASREE